MPIISVITPVYDPPREFLLAAYESLRSQELPNGWSWEWLVQEDGNGGEASQILPSNDERIRFGGNRKSGQAMTRNLALSSASGEFVKNLDQDDILTPGVLSRDISVLTEHEDVQWTTSRVLDLMPDGSLVGFDNDPPEGPLQAGAVVEHWRRHNYRLPVHPTTLCIRRPLAVALGGWMAVPGSEDTGLLIAAAAITTGWFIGEVGLHYRKHPEQQSAAASHTAPVEWQARMKLISERGEKFARLWGGRRADADTPRVAVSHHAGRPREAS